MKKISYVIGLFVLATCLLSCEEEVPVKDMGLESKLVLHCFLSPQYDTIAVTLSRSKSIFHKGTISAEVEYAVVEISSDNKTWTQIPYSKENNCYLLPQYQFPIVEGKTYYIRASSPNYETVTSSCTVPIWREVELSTEVAFETQSGKYPYYGTYAFLSLSWKDYRGEENYYSAMTAYLNYYEFYAPTAVVLSDKGKDGEKMNAFISAIEDCTYSDFMEYSEYPKYIIFMQTDRNCFLYENSIGMNRESSWDFESAFMIEPSLVYNNIKNGYGVFGALTFKTYKVDFRKETVEEDDFLK